jgi:hypothetical protein
MLISYGRPAEIDWAIVGGTFVGDPDDLVNGQPASPCRIRWNGDSSGVLVITASFDATALRSAGFLSPRFSTEGLIPEGVKIEFSGKHSGGSVALGGNALNKRTVTHPNGATRRPAVFPSATVDQLILTIYDNKNGSPWVTHDSLYDLGEFWFGKGADFGIKQDLKIALQGGLLQRKSHQNQNWPWAVKAYQAPSFNITPMTEAEAIGPRSDQDDFQTVMYALAEDSTCVLIPSYIARNDLGHRHAPPTTIDATVISEQRLCRTFMIGNLDASIELDGDGNQYFVSPIAFGESPP